MIQKPNKNHKKTWLKGVKILEGMSRVFSSYSNGRGSSCGSMSRMRNGRKDRAFLIIRLKTWFIGQGEGRDDVAHGSYIYIYEQMSRVLYLGAFLIGKRF